MWSCCSGGAAIEGKKSKPLMCTKDGIVTVVMMRHASDRCRRRVGRRSHCKAPVSDLDVGEHSCSDDDIDCNAPVRPIEWSRGVRKTRLDPLTEPSGVQINLPDDA